MNHRGREGDGPISVLIHIPAWLVVLPQLESDRFRALGAKVLSPLSGPADNDPVVLEMTFQALIEIDVDNPIEAGTVVRHREYPAQARGGRISLCPSGEEYNVPVLLR